MTTSAPIKAVFSRQLVNEMKKKRSRSRAWPSL
jgi:hypothetical protein